MNLPGITDPNPGEGELATLKRILAGPSTVFTPEGFGALADGNSHPLSGMFGSLAAAQAVYPDATALTNELDWAATQKAVGTAQILGGAVVLSPKTYVFNLPLLVSGAMSINGSGVSEVGTEADNTESVNLPTTAPYLKGTVILQTGAGQNGINITASGAAANLRDFGIRFADAIRFTNTGHGVYAMPPVLNTSFRNSGVMNCSWDNVVVFGHDGAHYAFWICNPLQFDSRRIRGYGGGGICVETNGQVNINNFLGNSAFVRPYFNTFVRGTTHPYFLKNTSGETILMTFLAPQAWIKDERTAGYVSNLPDPAAQKTFMVDPTAINQGTGTSRWLTIVAPDLETDVPGVTYSIPDAPGIFLGPGLINDYSNVAAGNTTVQDIRMDALRIYNGTLSYPGDITTTGSANSTGTIWARAGNATKPANAIAGDLISTRSTTTGVIYLGSDGQGFIYRSGNILAIGPLPTSDPHTATALWNNGGVLNISNG